nr:MAG: hypothetical protein 1 [Tombusviridae sp.]
MRQGDQQTLVSKHRWSRQDLQTANLQILRERVKALETTLENLRRQHRRSSTAKSVACTKAMRVDSRGSRAGASQSNQVPKSCPPSTKNAGKKKNGTQDGPVQPAIVKPFAGDRKSKPTTVLATKAKPDPSIAMSAKVSQKTGSAPQVVGAISNSPAAKARELPRYAGVSYAATLQKGSVAENIKPVLSVDRTEIDASIIPKSKKRGLRALDKRWCDEELTNYLRMEFAFQERTPDTLRLMHNRLSKHLRQYDTSQFTQKEVYEISINVVDAAMRISEHEQRVRAGMKNETAVDEMRKNNKFVTQGLAGRKGLFGKVVALPTSTKA